MTPEDQEKLARLQAVIDGHGTMREAREASGLSLKQAMRVTGLSEEKLLRLEKGTEEPTPDEHALLCLTYDVAGWVKPNEDEKRS